MPIISIEFDKYFVLGFLFSTLINLTFFDCPWRQTFGLNVYSFRMSFRDDLKCCKCDGEYNRSLSGRDKANECQRRDVWANILNLTCPYSFDDAEMSSIAGCDEAISLTSNQENGDDFSASTSATATAQQTMLLLSLKGRWVRCCCSRNFCKFLPIVTTKTSSTSGKKYDLSALPVIELKRRQRQNYWMTLRTRMRLYNERLVNFVVWGTFYVASSFSMMVVLWVLMMDPNIWNEIEGSMAPQEIFAEVVVIVVKGIKNVVVSP